MLLKFNWYIPDNFLGQNICAFIKIKNRVKLTQSSIFNELKTI